eukprot:TRINITY_DN4634_c1_g1_i1.p1 TRINITY_DN4634_c1_g1~~TRINITY_DN4634_c1_g1_i1.p1  ORF type:complete len:285 (+),score=77.13 TRINITY_DN4634_c1_g1_i1:75-857(+)
MAAAANHQWWDAVRAGDAGSVAEQLEADAALRDEQDPKARRTSGRKAIHEASGLGHAEVVEVLLRSGARPDEVDHFGRTPVMLAAALGRKDVLVCLLRELTAAHGDRVGFPVSVLDVEGQSALHYGAATASGECIRLLLEHGADPNVAGKQGLSPLEFAAKCERQATISQELHRVTNLRSLRRRLHRAALVFAFSSARGCDYRTGCGPAAERTAWLPPDLIGVIVSEYLLPDAIPEPPSVQPPAKSRQSPRQRRADCSVM